jgi:hypothetical protein
LPECIFTNGFVGLYNESIWPINLPTIDIAAGTDGKTGAAAPVGAHGIASAKAPSGIRQRDILHHINAYGERCLTIEAQLNGLIDYLQNPQKPGQTQR